jgi:hypothetical protein
MFSCSSSHTRLSFFRILSLCAFLRFSFCVVVVGVVALHQFECCACASSSHRLPLELVTRSCARGDALHSLHDAVCIPPRLLLLACEPCCTVTKSSAAIAPLCVCDPPIPTHSSVVSRRSPVHLACECTVSDVARCAVAHGEWLQVERTSAPWRHRHCESNTHT